MPTIGNLRIKLDPQAQAGLSEQLYASIRRHILSGELRAGDRLPSGRDLAERLGISRPTIAVAFEQLEQEGYVEFRPGLGAFVKELIVPQLSMGKSGGKTIPMSLYARELSTSIQTEAHRFRKQPDIAFYCWRAAFDQFPSTEWARIVGRHVRETEVGSLDSYFEPAGALELREAVVQTVRKHRGIECKPEQVVITSGLNQALELTARLHLDKHNQGFVENPGYHVATTIFKAHASSVIPVPVDELGLRIQDCQSHNVGEGSLVYVTPSHQFPTGATMPVSRRLELLDWAERTNAVIVEDDYDSEYEQVGKPIPALMSLDKSRRVIYVGTFNQLMFPGLGVAFLIVPENLTSTYIAARQLIGEQAPRFLQTATAEFVAGGHLDRHIRKLRQVYTERRLALYDALDVYFGNRVTVRDSTTGVFLLARFKSRLSSKQICERASNAGIGVTSTEMFYTGKAPEREIILGFGALAPKQIRQGIKRLAAAIN